MLSPVCVDGASGGVAIGRATDHSNADFVGGGYPLFCQLRLESWDWPMKSAQNLAIKRLRVIILKLLGLTFNFILQSSLTGLDSVSALFPALRAGLLSVA